MVGPPIKYDINWKEIANRALAGEKKADLARELKVSTSLLSWYLRKNGASQGRCEWTSYEDSVITEQYEKTHIDKLKDLLPNRSVFSIRRRAHELGIKKDISIYEHSSPQSDLAVLLNDSLTTFYYMGLLAADGWTGGKKKKTTLGIRLAIKDKNYLLQYAKYIKCNNILEVEPSIAKPGALVQNNGKSIVVVASNKDLVPLIAEKFDFKVKKSFYAPEFSKYENFTLGQLKAFLIGFMDGDANLQSIIKINTEDYINDTVDFNSFGEHSTGRIEVLYTWEFFLVGLFTKIFDSNPSTSKRQKENRQEMFTLYLKSKHITILKQFIIENNLPVMKRKWPFLSTGVGLSNVE